MIKEGRSRCQYSKQLRQDNMPLIALCTWSKQNKVKFSQAEGLQSWISKTLGQLPTGFSTLLLSSFLVLPSIPWFRANNDQYLPGDAILFLLKSETLDILRFAFENYWFISVLYMKPSMKTRSSLSIWKWVNQSLWKIRESLVL